jgi:hypothetical protein
MSSSLDPKIIKKVSDRVYKQFPEVVGVKPNIRKQTSGQRSKQNGKSAKDIYNFLLTFRRKVDLGNGKKMDRRVRVVVDTRGKILKMTTSR